MHENKAAFRQMQEDTAASMGFSDAGIVEKDYFVTYFLQKIAKKSLA